MTVARKTTVVTVATAGGLTVAAAACLGLVTGRVPLDLGVGRRTRSLGPFGVDIAAPRAVVFDVIAAPYSERPPRALREKVRVLERGQDMVLAAHFTPLSAGLRATTVETVRFTPPERVDFRLVRGPVPHVVERFTLDETAAGTRLSYSGELGTDLWEAGRQWGDVVARRWQEVVAASFDAIRTEAERRAL